MAYTPFEWQPFLQKLQENSIYLSQKAEYADVLVAQKAQRLHRFSKRFGNSKRYLVFTLEPRFDLHEESIADLPGGAKAYILNCHSGSLLINNHQLSGQCLTKLGLNDVPDWYPLTTLDSRKVAMLAVARFSGWDFWRGGQDLDLCKFRTHLAWQGYKRGLIDLYGPRWGKAAIENSRGHGWQIRKHEILKQYRFNLCIENTNLPYYCTEKIWQAIAAHCLPIYYGNTTIYEDFPRNSFIDCRKFASNQALFKKIETISVSEYNERLQACIENHKEAVRQNKNEYFFERVYNMIISFLLKEVTKEVEDDT